MKCLTMFASPGISTLVPRADRFIALERLRRLWRFLACPIRTLPLAVILKRFLAPLLVLSLGMAENLEIWGRWNIGPRPDEAGKQPGARMAPPAERRVIAA